MRSVDEWIGEKIPDELLDEAAYWIARLDSDQADQHDRLAFARWLDQDPIHQHAFQELSPVWARMSTLGDIKNLIDDEKVVRLHTKPFLEQSQASAPLFGAAPVWQVAVVFLLMLVGFIAQSMGDGHLTVYETEVGGYKMVQLEDGSSVHLNTDTRLMVRMDTASRTIWIERGEAYFDVAPDPERPFTVVSEYGQVAALGTEFLVKLDEPGFDVAVHEGAVKVVKTQHGQSLTGYESLPVKVMKKSTDLLQEGEALFVYNDISKVSSFSPLEARAALSWKEGKLTFSNHSLQGVLDEMERYAAVRFQLADKKLEKKIISGQAKAGNIQSYLKLLENNGIYVSHQRGKWHMLNDTPT